MCGLAMDLTILDSSTGSVTSITVRGADFLEAQQCRHRLLKGENVLWATVKGKKHVPPHEGKIQGLIATPKVSVTPEEMSLHRPETNLEKQTGEKCESGRSGDLGSSTADLMSPTPGTPGTQGPAPPAPPPGRAKEACPLTNGKRELKGQSALAERSQDTV